MTYTERYSTPKDESGKGTDLNKSIRTFISQYSILFLHSLNDSKILHSSLNDLENNTHCSIFCGSLKGLDWYKTSRRALQLNLCNP